MRVYSVGEDTFVLVALKKHRPKKSSIKDLHVVIEHIAKTKIPVTVILDVRGAPPIPYLPYMSGLLDKLCMADSENITKVEIWVPQKKLGLEKILPVKFL